MHDYSTLFPNLSDHSKVWVYVSSTQLEDSTSTLLESVLKSFGEAWSSHGRVVKSDFKLIDKQIVVLGAEVEQGNISGCGIDKSLHVLEGFAGDHSFEWVTALAIVYRDSSGSIHIVSRPDFRRLVRNSEVTNTTLVLDASLSSLKELREQGLEKMAGTSWHAGVFAIPSTMTV